MDSNTLSPRIIGNLSSRNYLVGEKIGEGGFSTVFTVHNDITEEIFAAKVINISKLKLDSSQRNYDFTKVVDSEINLMKSVLTIQGVVHYSNHFLFDDHLVIIIEFCRGGNLDQLIRKTNNNRGLDEKVISVVLKQILCTLYQVHQLGIIHRDIKPSNIMICNKKLKIKLSDFGLSYYVDENETSIRTKTMMGTRRYLSPEILSGSTDNKSSLKDTMSSPSYSYSYSSKSDIWSVGVVLVDMIFGSGVISVQDLGCRNNIEFIIQDIDLNRKTNSFNEVLKACLSIKKEDRKSCREILRLSPLNETRISSYKSSTTSDVYNNNTNLTPNHLGEQHSSLRPSKSRNTTHSNINSSDNLSSSQLMLKIGPNTYTYTLLPLICQSHRILISLYYVLTYDVSDGGYLNVDIFKVINQFFQLQIRSVRPFIDQTNFDTITDTTQTEIFGHNITYKISDESRRLLKQLKHTGTIDVHCGTYDDYLDRMVKSYGVCMLVYPYDGYDYGESSSCLYFRISDFQVRFSDIRKNPFKCPCYI